MLYEFGVGPPPPGVSGKPNLVAVGERDSTLRGRCACARTSWWAPASRSGRSGNGKGVWACVWVWVWVARAAWTAEPEPEPEPEPGLEGRANQDRTSLVSSTKLSAALLSTAKPSGKGVLRSDRWKVVRHPEERESALARVKALARLTRRDMHRHPPLPLPKAIITRPVPLVVGGLSGGAHAVHELDVPAPDAVAVLLAAAVADGLFFVAWVVVSVARNRQAGRTHISHVGRDR